MYTVNEIEMLQSIIAYLEEENRTELSTILQVSKFIFDPQFEFSNIISYQRKLYASLRVPIKFIKFVEENLDYLSKLACRIYIDNDDYYFLGINNVGMMPIQTEEIDFNHKHIVMERDSIFTNFIKFIIDYPNLNEIQQRYLFEACECGDKNNILAASVMLGASAELLLIDFCNAYCEYLRKNETTNAVEAFERKVIRARCAYDRLSEFQKYANSNAQFFRQIGFENIDLSFSTFDIIRQTRNDSGHPTGNSISQDQFKIILGNYQHILQKTIESISALTEK